jgi:hypothetical protein
MCNDRGSATTRKRNGPNWDMGTTIEAALAGGLLEEKAKLAGRTGRDFD